MEVQDDVWQGFVSSLVSDDNRGSDALSPEDAAWADSCLVKNADLSENGWNAFKDALVDIISSETSSNDNSSTANSDGFPRQTHDDVSPMSEDAGMVQISESNDNDQSLIIGQAETTLLGGSHENLTSLTEKEDFGMFRGFLLNKLSDSHDQKKIENTDVSSNQELTNETEPFPDNIFQVWDLETHEFEEDELIQQLEKALAANPFDTLEETPLDPPLPVLAESPLVAPPPALADSPLVAPPAALAESSLDAPSPALVDLITDQNMESLDNLDIAEESLDDLIASMGDLSLHQLTGS